MNSAQRTIDPGDVIRTMKTHPLWLLVPIAALTAAAVGYAFLKAGTWEASQALIVRDEAGDRLSRPGKFAHADEMKTSQETILELVKSRNVLSRALTEVGPSGHDLFNSWPSEKEVEALQDSVKIAPPKGAEFGKTEMFYLKVQASSQARAKELASAICRQLQLRFAELRETKARSTIDELSKSVELAKNELAAATDALCGIEKRVGGDLAELRILNESPSGDSDLRRMATDLEKELRAYRAAQAEGEGFLKILTDAKTDPTRLVASPSTLLKSQPGLGRLKDGLVDAQLRTSQAMGAMSEYHPLVRAALAAEDAIRQKLYDEISVAIQGVQLELSINAERISAIETQQSGLQARLSQLASVRAEYANLVSAAKNRSETLKTVQHELAEAQASGISAHSASLISLVDSPDTGTRPLGPSRSMIMLAGMFAGLAVGLGIVVLNVRRVEDLPDLADPLPAHIASEGNLNLKDAWQRVSNYRVYSSTSR